jgi:hypothetical protein
MTFKIRMESQFDADDDTANEVTVFEGEYSEDVTWLELFRGFNRGLRTLGFIPTKEKYYDAIDGDMEIENE